MFAGSSALHTGLPVLMHCHFNV